MKHLKYFEAASSKNNFNEFFRQIANRAVTLYGNIIPQIEGDIIKNWSRQDYMAKKIYTLIEKEAKNVYSNLSDKKNINYDAIMSVMTPLIDRILTSELYDLYKYMMVSVYKERYKEVLPDEEEYYSSEYGVDSDIESSDKKITDIYGRLLAVIDKEWNDNIHLKNPNEITQQDIEKVVSNMDTIVDEFRKSPQGIRWAKKISEWGEHARKSSVPKQYMSDFMTPVRQALDYGSIENRGGWNKSNLFNLTRKLPKYQQTPPKID